MPSFFDRLANSPYMPSARTWLLFALGILMVISLLMVASASIPFALSREYDNELRFFYNQFVYIVFAMAIGVIVYQVPLRVHYDTGTIATIYVVSVVLLACTLIFGESINGSKRWLSFFGFSFQPAEMAKVFFVLMLAEYMDRRSAELRYRTMVISLLRMSLWYVPILAILFFQPDYGSILLIGATMMVMFFVGGAPIVQYLGLGTLLGVLAVAGLFQADYRKTRLFSFLEPFDDVLDTDYQLSRSLVAFGRGEFSGVGYGNSIQKLAHLPEAHTDFLLAITGEELGFLGVSFVILLESIIIASMLRISKNALVRHQLKLAYTAFGFAVIIFGQVMINAGMNMGLLPTKGLTMPFYSYGGSSMLFSIIMVAIVLKIDRQSPLIAKDGDNRIY